MTTKLKYYFVKYNIWIISSVFLLILFISFMQMDLLETSRQGFVMSQGHILDFYTETKGSAYLPSTYILFGIWNIPISLLLMMMGVDINSLGFLGTRLFLYWNKILPVLFYIGCTFIIYKIMLETTKNKKISILTAFAFFTTPIAVYSQFIFGQYDSFTVFFILLGVYFAFKNDLLKFTLFFAIAITFKYTAVAIYLPLLLMRQKKVIEICKQLLVLIIPVVLEYLLFARPATASSFASSKLDYITETIITNPYFSIQIVVFAFVVFCAYAYFNEKVNDHNVIHWTMFYCNISVFLIFGLSAWHPQWLLLAVPFWVISTFINKNLKIFLLIDVLMMVFFVSYVSQNWIGIADQDLVRLSFLGDFFKYRTEYNAMVDFNPDFLTKDMAFTILSSLMFIQIFFKHPVYASCEWDDKLEQPLLFRFLIGVSIFMIPCVAALFSAVNSEQVSVNTTREYRTALSKVDENYNLGQIIQLAGANRKYQIVQFSYGEKLYDFKQMFVNLSDNPDRLIIPLTETDSEITYKIKITNSDNKILFENVAVSENGSLTYDINSLNLKKGETYYIIFENSDLSGLLLRSTLCFRDDLSYALINGVRQDFDIAIKIVDYKE